MHVPLSFPIAPCACRASLPSPDTARYRISASDRAVLAPCGQAMSELQNMASYLRFYK